MFYILWVLLVFRAIPPDSASKQTSNVILSTDSASVLLPCFNQIWDPETVSWYFKSSENTGYTICSVSESTPRCKSTAHPHIALAEADCFGTKDFSLLFTPALRDGGRYTCGVHVREGTSHVIGTQLIVFRVFVTPKRTLALGSTVSFTMEISDSSYTNNIAWDNQTARGTVNGIEFQWKHNGASIVRERRHSLDSRNFNISCFQKEDIGEYTLSVRLKDGMMASYSERLEVAEASPKSSIIVGIILAVIGVACLIATVIVIYIYKRTKLIQQNQPGNYVNVPLQPRGSNQNAAELDSAYMTLNLNERSLYSQLQR
ncbi:uncharacterized protein [Heterodontus francisci]|uniref:uncharacterized protein n=1 Tax=Heterodontus francisci TaxID=7792 RepID=UPI00355C049A